MSSTHGLREGRSLTGAIDPGSEARKEREGGSVAAGSIDAGNQVGTGKLHLMERRMNSINPPSVDYLKRPVVWNDDMYALGRDHAGNGKLCKYSPTSNKWSEFSVSQSVYATNSVLVTYRSKLLLISGEDMMIWEFNGNDLDFKQSSIGPVPASLTRCEFNTQLIAISKDDFLVILHDQMHRVHIHSSPMFVFNGTSWKIRALKYSRKLFSCDNGYIVANDCAIVAVVYRKYTMVTVSKAPLLLEETEDIDLKEVQMVSLENFNSLIYTGAYSTLLHNESIYFIDSRGAIFSSFIRPPIIVPIIWGNCDNEFQQVPHVAGLSGGALLLIGNVREKNGSTLDVIKVEQQEYEFNADNHVTMKALVTLEWKMNLPVLTTFKPWISELKDRVKLPESDTSAEPARRWIDAEAWCTDTLVYVIDYIDRWINRKEVNELKPTWRNLFKIMEDISPELGELAYQIKVLFSATEAVEDTSKLKADLVHLQSSCTDADTVMGGLKSSVALCGRILEKVQQADREKERLAAELQSKTKELDELHTQLQTYQQAEENNNSRKLTDKDLPFLLRQVKKHAAKWREIGTHLEFLPGELDTIEARPNLSQGAPISWFGAMLQDWLQWAPSDSRGSTCFATLEALKEALNDTGLGATAHDLKLKANS